MDEYMVCVEALMLSVMIAFCIQATITDLKYGLVKNKLVLCGFCVSFLFNVIYYFLFAQEYLIAFGINLIVIICLSVMFFVTHIWAAGDSKLLIFVVSLIPARIYYSGENVAATALIMISIFSIAFIYYVAESVVIGIKEKNLFSVERLKINVFRIVLQYIKCTCVVTVSSFVFAVAFQEFYTANTELFMIVNMLIILGTYNIAFLNKWYVIATFMIGAGTIIYLQGGYIEESVNWFVYLIVLVVIVLRMIAEKYNYKTIQTKDVKQGMILSYGTVILFAPSKVKGLPSATTEDMRSRISLDEANSIIRWADSKYGLPQITIVRKIPFAIFIFIGATVFVLTRIIF